MFCGTILNSSLSPNHRQEEFVAFTFLALKFGGLALDGGQALSQNSI